MQAICGDCLIDFPTLTSALTVRLCVDSDWAEKGGGKNDGSSDDVTGRRHGRVVCAPCVVRGMATKS